jgi:hypothetical protein
LEGALRALLLEARDDAGAEYVVLGAGAPLLERLGAELPFELLEGLDGALGAEREEGLEDDREGSE